MADLTPDQVRDLARRTITGANRSIYSPSNYGTEPRSIYFYYLVPQARGGAEVTAYYIDNGPLEITFRGLKRLVPALVENARKGDHVPPPVGKSFDAIPWRRRSWFLVVIGDPSVEFAEDNAILFNAGTHKAPNQAFLDGHDFTASVEGDTLSAVCCINHLYKNEHRDDLGDGETQDFAFSLIYSNATRTGFVPLDFDSGGTNMGPPAPPPGFLEWVLEPESGGQFVGESIEAKQA